jgi:hypothetical protein
MNRFLFFFFACAAVLIACSGSQNLGGAGRSLAGETCSNSADCADNLRCTSSVCGGSSGTDRVSTDVGTGTSESGPSCDTDSTCALRGSYDPYCKPGGDCTQCLTDDHCALNSSGKHCKVGPAARDRNECVDCLTNAHCTDPAAAQCSQGKYGNYCVECLADGDCKDATRPKCEVTQSGADSARRGYCRECLANADCKNKDKPICRIGYCQAP